MNTKENKWSLEEEQTLIDLRYEGKSIIEVAAILNRTCDSVRKKHWILMREKTENPVKFWEKVRLLEESGYFEMGENEEDMYQNPEEPEYGEVDKAVEEIHSVFEASKIINKTVVFVSVCAGLAVIIMILIQLFK